MGTAVAVLLCGCFNPDDPSAVDTDDGSSSGSTGPSTTDPTETSTSGPSTTDPTSTTEPGTATTSSTSDPSDTETDTVADDTTTTTGVEPACGDGNADPGELCLDMPPNTLTAPEVPVDVVVGDISSNGLMDIIVLARGTQSTDIVVTLEADGVGGYVQGTTEPTPSPAARLRLGDLDNDDDLDVVVHAGDIVWLRNQGSFFNDYQVATNFGGEWQVSDVFIADLDDDGILDVGYTEAYGRVWVTGALNNGNWTPAGSTDFPGPGEGAAGMAVAALSQDGDDDLDVIAFNQYYSSALVLPNAGGAFTVGPEVPLCPADVDGVRYGEVADFNGDGISDIVVTCMDGDGAVTLGNAGGFAPPFALPLAGAFKPSVADLDADGDPDVLIASTSLDRAVMFINDGDGAFELGDQQFMAPGPVYGAIGADMNDDGATDVVVISSPMGMAGRVDVYTADP